GEEGEAFMITKRLQGRGKKPGGGQLDSVCARHGAALTGWKSPCQVVAEPKARRRARVSSRGDVWRKRHPNRRGDAQEPARRGGTPGTSGHGPAEGSLRAGGGPDQSRPQAPTVPALTLGGLQAVWAPRQAAR